jgi:hypothetical protein
MHDATRVPANSRGLDRLNFLVAALQTGFGPFVVVYLTQCGWRAAEIGWMVTTGTVVAMAGQMPAGLLVERLAPRTAAALALAATGLAALMLALWPAPLPALLAAALQGFSGPVLSLSLTTMAVGAGDSAALAPRLGRILRYAAAGNATGAALMGASGSLLGPGAAIWLAALLCLPGLAALGAEPPAGRVQRPVRAAGAFPPVLPGIAGLLGFAVLFHIGNGSLMLLAASNLAACGGARANLVVGACVVAPQLVMVLLAGRFGRAAQRWGRPVLVLGLVALPLRALLFALVHDPMLMVAAQALDGISGAAFGLLVPLKAAELTRGHGGFAVVSGAVGLAAGLGAAISTSVAGGLAGAIGLPAAFLAFAAVGATAAALHAAGGFRRNPLPPAPLLEA